MKFPLIKVMKCFNACRDAFGWKPTKHELCQKEYKLVFSQTQMHLIHSKLRNSLKEEVWGETQYRHTIKI